MCQPLCCSCSLSHVRLFVTPRTTAHQASLSFAISWSLSKLMFIESVMPLCQAPDNSLMNSKIPLHGSDFDSLSATTVSSQPSSLSVPWVLAKRAWLFFSIIPLRFLQFPWSSNFVREKNKFSFLFYIRISFCFIAKSITTSPQAKQLSLTRFQPFKSTWGAISIPHLCGHSLIFLSFVPPSLLFLPFFFIIPSSFPAFHLLIHPAIFHLILPSIRLSINPIFLSIH